MRLVFIAGLSLVGFACGDETGGECDLPLQGTCQGPLGSVSDCCEPFAVCGFADTCGGVDCPLLCCVGIGDPCSEDADCCQGDSLGGPIVCDASGTCT